MSLLDDLQSTISHVGNAVGHAVGSAAGTVVSTVTGNQSYGQQIEHNIDTVSDAVFFDGAVKGTNPATIHKYFHNGPGTKSYGVAEATAKSLQSDYDDYASRAAKVTAKVEQSWQGPAAQEGLANVRQSQTIAQSFSQHMAAKQSAYAGQTQVFDSTKNSVVPMPDNPPPATNPISMDVISAASGAATAAVYQAGTKTNQQAYSSYQPPTQSHASGIPKGDTVTPGQSNVVPGPTPPGGPGISEPRSYSPTFGGSQDRHVTTGGQPVAPPAGGGQPGGSSANQPPVLPGSGDTSTGLAGYSGGQFGNPTPPATGGYDSTFGSRSGADGGFGSGSVFAGGGYGGGFGGGSGSGYGSGPGAASGRGGAAGPGNAAGAGAAQEAMAGRAGAAGARGAAGQAGAGGPGAGGRGGKKEEDKEHKTAAYLVTEEHGNEVVGDLPSSLPAGGVIGE
ncbi:hypothetical protein [Kutzneria sp. NPDC052558]|uniref:hypothetical protein n=1 Tax=Kutzneria sp. NPDC052558 TaxID=3364121 RepID=UPI0037C60DFB